MNGPSVFDSLFNDHSLGEGLDFSLGHDSFLSTVDESLLSVSEGMSLDLSSSTCDTGVGLPVVFSTSLLTGAVVAVSFDVHLSNIGFLLERASLSV